MKSLSSRTLAKDLADCTSGDLAWFEPLGHTHLPYSLLLAQTKTKQKRKQRNNSGQCRKACIMQEYEESLMSCVPKVQTQSFPLHEKHGYPLSMSPMSVPWAEKQVEENPPERLETVRGLVKGTTQEEWQNTETRLLCQTSHKKGEEKKKKLLHYFQSLHTNLRNIQEQQQQRKMAREYHSSDCQYFSNEPTIKKKKKKKGPVWALVRTLGGFLAILLECTATYAEGSTTICCPFPLPTHFLV